MSDDRGSTTPFKLRINLSQGTSSTSESNDVSKEHSPLGNNGSRPSSRLSRPNSRPGSSASAGDGLIKVQLETQTARGKKRKHIKTNFNDDLLPMSAIAARQKEKERLERLEKQQAGSHIDDMAAMMQYSQAQAMPDLDIDYADFLGPGYDLDANFAAQLQNEVDMAAAGDGDKPQLIDPAGDVKKEKRADDVEVIDLSDDDDVIMTGEVKAQPFRPYRVPPPTFDNYLRTPRTRWTPLVSKEDRDKEEQQREIEKARLAKRGHVGSLESTELIEGRLLVNAGHPKEEPDMFVAPHLTHVLQPHQLGGIRFMYSNVVESIHEYKTTPGFGCILAHSMGLGKTIQVITFTDVFLRATAAHKVIIIMPINTIQNWYAEFNKWMPRMNDRGELLRKFEVYLLGDTVKTFDQRVNMIEEWHKRGGVLLIGYDMFRLLIKATQPKKNKTSRPRLNLASLDRNGAGAGDGGDKDAASPAVDAFDQGTTAGGRDKKDANMVIRTALLDPGPDLVVCDEGHKIKNLATDISASLNAIATKRRIVLTGSPLQNNLMEYYCMVDFVRPMYLGNKKSFSIMFEKPIKNGQCTDSTTKDVRLALQRTHVLLDMLKGFVQRRTHHLLRSILPESREWVILLRKSPIQHLLYRNFVLYAKSEIDSSGTGSATFNPLKAFAACSKIWNHPDILYAQLEKLRNERREQEDKGHASSSSESYATDPFSVPSTSSPWPALPLLAPPNMALLSNPFVANGWAAGGMDMMNNMNPFLAGQPSQHTQLWGGLWNANGAVPPAGGGANGAAAAGDMKAAYPAGTLGDVLGASRARSGRRGVKGDENENGSGKRGRGRGKKAGGGGAAGPNGIPTLADALAEELDLEKFEGGLKYDWADVVMQNYVPGLIENGYKMSLALSIINETTKLGEKILLFSQNLTALSCLEEYLEKEYVQVEGGGQPGERWRKNTNYFRFDGSTSGADREKLINRFNSDPTVRLFLISTRAGSLGINLVSANRVIILDACWNPVHDAQAVCRVYRYGQKKRTYIYRLVMDNSMEKAIFNRQISKTGLQHQVVDDKQVDVNLTRKELEKLLVYDEALDVVHHEWDVAGWEADPEMTDPVLKTIARQHAAKFAEKPFLHESMLTERDEGLSEQEKAEALLLFEKEKNEEANPLPPYWGGDMDGYGATPPLPPRAAGMVPHFARGGAGMAYPYGGLPMSALDAPALRATPIPKTLTPMPNYRGGLVGGPYSLGRRLGASQASTAGPTQPLSGQPFPGAFACSEPVINQNGSVQRVVTDRVFSLPAVAAGGLVTDVGEKTEAMLVRTGQGVYLRLNDGSILDAKGTVFDDGKAIVSMANGSPQVLLPAMDRKTRREMYKGTTVQPEDVIDLD